MGNSSFSPEKRGGGVSWAILGGVVLTLEMREETLSNALSRFQNKNTMCRGITYAAIGTLALHLVDALPEGYDPVDRFADYIADALEQYASKGAHIP